MRRVFVLFLSLVVCAFGAATASASIQYSLGNVFTSDLGAPGGSSPYLTATIETQGSNVKFTLDTPGLVSGEFVSEWYFNFIGDATTLSILSQMASAGSVGTVALSFSGLQADGDGIYDFKFDFPSGAPANRFGFGDTLMIVLTSSAGPISETDFDLLAEPGGGFGPFHTAAHIQGSPPDGEGGAWVSDVGVIPEAASLVVWSLLIGSAGYITARRRRGDVT